MCRTIHAMLSAVICGIQMAVRVFMTTILMIENIVRMFLQTLYNFLSFLMQLLSLIPICCVFLVTSRMKCFMCGGGGPCPVNRGGACDCLMSVVAIVILFFIFRATGVLDKIFYNIGYAKATTKIVHFIPTTGLITECSRNDTDTEYVFYPLETTPHKVLREMYFYIEDDLTTILPTNSADDSTNSSLDGTSSSLDGTTSSLDGTTSSVDGTTSSLDATTSSLDSTSTTTNTPGGRRRGDYDYNETVIETTFIYENYNDTIYEDVQNSTLQSQKLDHVDNNAEDSKEIIANVGKIHQKTTAKNLLKRLVKSTEFDNSDWISVFYYS